MALSKKIVEDKLNEVLHITDASLQKIFGFYCFKSEELKTHLWENVNLNIHTTKGSSLEAFVLAVEALIQQNPQKLKPKDPEPPKEIIPCYNTDCPDYDPDTESHCAQRSPYTAMKCPDHDPELVIKNSDIRDVQVTAIKQQLKGLQNYTREELEAELRVRDQEVYVLIIPVGKAIRENVKILYNGDKWCCSIENALRKSRDKTTKLNQIGLECHRVKKGDLNMEEVLNGGNLG